MREEDDAEIEFGQYLDSLEEEAEQKMYNRLFERAYPSTQLTAVTALPQERTAAPTEPASMRSRLPVDGAVGTDSNILAPATGSDFFASCYRELAVGTAGAVTSVSALALGGAVVRFGGSIPDAVTVVNEVTEIVGTAQQASPQAHSKNPDFYDSCVRHLKELGDQSRKK